MYVYTYDLTAKNTLIYSKELFLNEIKLIFGNFIIFLTLYGKGILRISQYIFYELIFYIIKRIHRYIFINSEEW